MRVSRNTVSYRSILRSGGMAAALSLALGGAAAADAVSLGRTSGGGLGVGVSLGGVKADVSLGGSSAASVKADVGGVAKADATVAGSSVATATASVGSSVTAGATVAGGGNLADVTANIGNTGVGACVGANCGTVGNVPGTNPPGTNPPGTTPPGTHPPGTVATTAPGQTPPRVPKLLACASADGNTTAFNGYPLTDRQGRVLGVVHSVQLGNGTRIETVSIRDIGKGCTTLKQGGFTVAGYAIKGSFDAQKMGLAFQ